RTTTKALLERSMASDAVQKLSLFALTGMVVGSMVGSGIFSRACSFARALGVCLAGFLTVTSPAAALQAIDLSDLAAQVIDAVVNISTSTRATGGANPRNQGPRPEVAPGTGGQPNQQRLQSSLGSGFVIDASGIIITNEHVIRNAEEITVILNNGTRLPAELL